MTEQADIEHTVGEVGTYDIVITEKRKKKDISAFTGGTIRYTKGDTPETVIASKTLSIAVGDNFTVQYTLPDLTLFAIGDALFADFIAQLDLTGSGTRFSRIMSVRIYKQLGDTT